MEDGRIDPIAYRAELVNPTGPSIDIQLRRKSCFRTEHLDACFCLFDGHRMFHHRLQ